MATYTDISKWNKQPHYHTGGTRDKFVVISPKDKKHYFKTSLKKENKDYKFEFWSEIIAFEIGKWLGFNVLSYNIASFDDKIGCISPSIIDDESEELHEGYRYLTQIYEDFSDTYKKTHCYQRIVGTLKKFDLPHFEKHLIELIVFDAIIGNSDRHSENWGFVVSKGKVNNFFDSYKKASLFDRLKLTFYSLITINKTISEINKIHWISTTNFAPIYDNGSSLGRELSNEKINGLLEDKLKLWAFIEKGKPDIRWNEKKLNHFEIVQSIKNEKKELISETLLRVKNIYNKRKVQQIVKNIDNNVPPRFSKYKLPMNRKKFIVEYIDLRINKLIEI